MSIQCLNVASIVLLYIHNERKDCTECSMLQTSTPCHSFVDWFHLVMYLSKWILVGVGGAGHPRDSDLGPSDHTRDSGNNSFQNCSASFWHYKFRNIDILKGHSESGKSLGTINKPYWWWSLFSQWNLGTPQPRIGKIWVPPLRIGKIWVPSPLQGMAKSGFEESNFLYDIALQILNLLWNKTRRYMWTFVPLFIFVCIRNHFIVGYAMYHLLV